MDKCTTFSKRRNPTPLLFVSQSLSKLNFRTCGGSIIRVEKLGEPAAIECLSAGNMLARSENKPFLMISQSVRSFIVC